MNKSYTTNGIAIVALALGYQFEDTSWGSLVFSMGCFAFSGAITNLLAVHMLFERVPGLYGSGVIPARFEDFKTGIEQLIMNQFFTSENISRFFRSDSSGSADALMAAVDFDLMFQKLIAAVLESPLGGMLGMFGGAQALEPVAPVFKVKMKEALADIVASPEFHEAVGPSLSGDGLKAKVQEVVHGRLNELTPQMVKEIIQEMIRRHLGWLVVWGGIFGALIGALYEILSLSPY